MCFQNFNTNVPRETYAIVGNDAIFKCEIPSFVADLVKVVAWADESGKEYLEMSRGMNMPLDKVYNFPPQLPQKNDTNFETVFIFLF